MDTRRPIYLSFFLLTVACSEQRQALQAPSPPADDAPSPAGEEPLIPPNREVTPATWHSTPSADSGHLCFPPEPAPKTPGTPRADPERRAAEHVYFLIHTVDANTREPIAGVRLRTTSHLSFSSDADGVVPFYEPGLMERSVYFFVEHERYEVAADDFGQRGVVLHPREGHEIDIALQRVEQVSRGATGLRPPLRPPEEDYGQPDARHCFGVRAIDHETQRGIPLVGFSHGEHQAWTDSQGYAAFCAADLLKGHSLRFAVETHGYELPEDKRWVELTPRPAKRDTVELVRMLPGERLYRITGQGIYADSALLGLRTPIREPLLNAAVTGQDTSDSERFQGRLFWIWGDTLRVDYALGSFRASGATSTLPERGGLQATAGIDLAYVTDPDGFAAAMVTPFGKQLPTWINGLAAVRDKNGRERLFAGYMQANPDLSAAETGVMEYDPAAQRFEPILRHFPADAGVYPDGNSYRVRHGERAYVYFRQLLRVPAYAEAFRQPSRYEVYSAHAADGSDVLLRTPAGEPSYAFRRQAKPTTLKTLRTAGIPAKFSLDGNIRAFGSGEAIELVGTSESWNQHRGRYLRLGQQRGGTSSYLGEIWLLEGDTPMGPWVYATHVVTHDGYTFYNVRQHPDLSREHSRFVYFDGTFTTTFTARPLAPIPRYDYNQVMYRLDLEDPRLGTPVAVYELPTPPSRQAQELALKDHLPAGLPPLRAAFFALDRPRDGAVAAFYSGPSCRTRRLQVGTPTEGLTALFYGLPLSTQPAPADMVPLYAYENGAGQQRYGVAAKPPEGYRRKQALMLVWRNPSALALPVSDYLGEVMAKAGPDRCLLADPEEGTVTLTVDGRGSRSSHGPIERYRWRVQQPDECLVVNGEQTTLTLPVGMHTISLEVQTPLGAWDRDSMVIEITEPSP